MHMIASSKEHVRVFTHVPAHAPYTHAWTHSNDTGSMSLHSWPQHALNTETECWNKQITAQKWQSKQTKTLTAYESLSRTWLTLLKAAPLSFSMMINSISQKTNKQNAADKRPCTSSLLDLWCQKWSLSLKNAEGSQGCRGRNGAARSDGERC